MSRFYWIKANGEIPKGMWVLHTCNNPLCVELTHLHLGTPLDNALYMIKCKRHVGNYVDDRSKDKEKLRLSTKKYKEEHREEIKSYRREYYLSNRS